MKLKDKTEKTEDYLEHWPESYYKEMDPKRRREMLEHALNAFENNESEQKRSRIYKLRYGRNMADQFMRVWLDLKFRNTNEAVPFFKRRRKVEEIRSLYAQFGIYEEDFRDVLLPEWHHFARTVITTNADDRGFNSTLLGLVSITDESAAKKLADEMHAVLKEVPEKYGLQDEVKEFREVFHEEYINNVENGSLYWH